MRWSPVFEAGWLVGIYTMVDIIPTLHVNWLSGLAVKPIFENRFYEYYGHLMPVFLSVFHTECQNKSGRLFNHHIATSYLAFFNLYYLQMNI